MSYRLSKIFINEDLRYEKAHEKAGSCELNEFCIRSAKRMLYSLKCEKSAVMSNCSPKRYRGFRMVDQQFFCLPPLLLHLLLLSFDLVFFYFDAGLYLKSFGGQMPICCNRPVGAVAKEFDGKDGFRNIHKVEI